MNTLRLLQRPLLVGLCLSLSACSGEESSADGAPRGQTSTGASSSDGGSGTNPDAPGSGGSESTGGASGGSAAGSAGSGGAPAEGAAGASSQLTALGLSCSSSADCDSGFCDEGICLLALSDCAVADVEKSPGNGWSDSYSADGKCYCATTFDHDAGALVVDTPAGQKTVLEVCTALGPGPGIDGNPVYNDVQCGNGPANDAGDEDYCPGRVDQSDGGCCTAGPKWDLSIFND